MDDFVTPIAAFALGAALARANSCTVASARRLVLNGKADWLIGLGVAISWAGLTLAAVAVLMPQVVTLPAQLPLATGIVVGGIILGLGALVNQGCVLGSVSRLGHGDLHYLFTVIGIALALHFAPVVLPIAKASPAYRPTMENLVFGLLFVPLALYGLWRWWSLRSGTLLALVAVGIAGGVVYACNPGWSYTSGAGRLVQSEAGWQSWLAESGTVAVFAGVAVSSALKGNFELRYTTLRGALTRFAGGALMGTGASMIPGGNDTLMLWAIPGQTSYGLIAYATMVLTIVAAMVAEKALSRRYQTLRN